MTDIKITELVAISPLAETDILPIISNPLGAPVTEKVTLKEILDKRLNYSIQRADSFSLGTGTTAQSAFPTTGDVFTLAGSTTYKMEGLYLIEKSGTSCTVGLAFAMGGGTTITSMKYVAQGANTAKNTSAATQFSAWVDRVTATVVTPTASTDTYIKFSGIVRMNVGGTVTPQVIFSAAPTTPIMVADSFIQFTPIGTDTENVMGAVS